MKHLGRLVITQLITIASFAGTLYSVLPIPHPGSPGTADILSLNNLGEVTGWLSVDGGNNIPFVATTSGYQLLAAPEPQGARGLSINDSGQVAEQIDSPINGVTPAFIATTSSVTPIPLPSPVYTGNSNIPGYSMAFPVGINNSGELIGTAIGTNIGSNVPPELFIGTPDALELIPLPSGWQPAGLYGFNNSGQVVGELSTNGSVDTYQPFVGTTSGVTFIPIPPSWGLAYAGAINDSGEVAGYGGAPGQGTPIASSQAFVWSPTSGLTLIPLPPGATYSYLDLEGGPEINSSGEVIGLSDAGAWIWDQADGVQLVNNLAPMGWTIDGVFGVNNSGQILATASFAGSRIDYVLLTPESTPEPGSVILTSTAFLVVAIICRSSPPILGQIETLSAPIAFDAEMLRRSERVARASCGVLRRLRKNRRTDSMSWRAG